jgi:hypothetical protein
VPDRLPPEERYLFHGLQKQTGMSFTHFEIVTQPICLFHAGTAKKNRSVRMPFSMDVRRVNCEDNGVAAQYLITSLFGMTDNLKGTKDDCGHPLFGVWLGERHVQ